MPKELMKIFLIFAWASIILACDSFENKTANNIGKNQSATNVNVNINVSLNENAYTTAGNSSLGNLKPSVGKTVGEIKLWQNEEINTRLKKLMGADYTIMKKFWNTETPIKKFGDFLMMTGCEQHNCGDNQYVIFMDTSEGNINVVHIHNKTTKRWNENGEIDLPPTFADELSKMQSNN